MNLTDIFDALQYGELANISISGDIDQPKVIRQQDWPLLISHINMGLSDLHTKLNLKDREIILEQKEGKTSYRLHSENAVSTGDTDDKFIKDTVDLPFKDDLIRINAVYDELGCMVPVNDSTYDESIFLPLHDVVQIPYPVQGNTLFIIYKAGHYKIAKNITNPDDVDIDLPDYCLEPLLTYVASRVHASKINAESQTIAVNLMGKYNLMIEDLKKYNVLHNDPNDTNIKLGERGWV